MVLVVLFFRLSADWTGKRSHVGVWHSAKYELTGLLGKPTSLCKECFAS
jgi:hypothetical protein